MDNVRKLPVGAAFGHSVNSTIHNLKFAFDISWPWMVVLLPINVFTQIYLMAHPVTPGQMPDGNTILIGLFVILSSMLVFASIAVSWHRYILKDEYPKGLDRLRLDSLVLRYFGNSILIVLCCALVAMVAVIPFFLLLYVVAAASKGLAAALGVAAYIAGVLAVVGLAARLSIKLVAVALGRTDFSMSDALDVSKGNQWRVVGLYILFSISALLVSLVFGVATYFLVTGSNIVLLCVGIAVQMVFKWVTTIWGITLLTSLYGFFEERRSF